MVTVKKLKSRSAKSVIETLRRQRRVSRIAAAREAHIETERLKRFKALLDEYGGKCEFAGFDE